jgi:hypothetical protein
MFFNYASIRAKNIFILMFQASDYGVFAHLPQKVLIFFYFTSQPSPGSSSVIIHCTTRTKATLCITGHAAAEKFPENLEKLSHYFLHLIQKNFLSCRPLS